VNNNQLSQSPLGPGGDFVELPGHGPMYMIRRFDLLPPFLVSLTSPDDHWLYASTSGALTCGRRSPERALFPYETDDRLHRAGGLRGPVTAIWVAPSRDPAATDPEGSGGDPRRAELWRPFRGAAGPGVSRNLYKSALSDSLVFEEHHAPLGLTFRACWATSRRYGVVRSVSLRLHGPRRAVEVAVLDGLVDLEPALVALPARQSMSNLVDAYTRCERVGALQLALCALEARIIDRPEPAEALRATLVWSVGLEEAPVILREDAFDAFTREAATCLEGPRAWSAGDAEAAVTTGRRGAFLLSSRFGLAAGAQRDWHLVGEVHADHTAIAAVTTALADPGALRAGLEADVADGRARLRRLVASVDGVQLGADRTQTAALASSALFNAMRGGLPIDGHRLPARDLAAFVASRSLPTARRRAAALAELEDGPVDAVVARVAALGDPDLLRLTLEYLPLWFSRRHGDPSRPWNHFTIRLSAPDGARRLHWQGNWRDIFQNWEALCESFPGFALGAVVTFVDASTADGGNPYRVSRRGVDWEVPEPDHPWSHIGYWGDHQIVYATRLLDLTRRVRPGRLEALLDQAIFTYADVPYRLAPYAELREDPHHTITFDAAHQARVEARVEAIGGDGRLLHRQDGELTRVTLAEKLLVPALAKLSNLVLDGGVWMNTQRPEWNDANNALVGWGLSVVTAAHLRRYCELVAELLETRFGRGAMRLSAEVDAWLGDVLEALRTRRPLLAEPTVSAAARADLLDALGEAFGRYRAALYHGGLSDPVPRATTEGLELLRLARDYLDHTLRANRRSDGLYHAYNVMEPTADGIALCRLPLMLEGQVAALDSGAVGPAEAAELMDALFKSALYRPDQSSFMLYPATRRRSFLDRNVIPESALRVPLVARLLSAEVGAVIARDAAGTLRFHGDLANARDLGAALDALDPERVGEITAADRAALLALWEEVFAHRAFTGRSGTMHAYEGIGSIYWHMVSKLQLAVYEAYAASRAEPAADGVAARLARAYHAIRRGMGPAKSPSLQGAFPTDPHSHTPLHRGAQQPGMTGQAKEAVLVRRRELGLTVVDGVVHIAPRLLPAAELLASPGTLAFVDVDGVDREVAVPPGGFGFTYCQVPVVLVTRDVPWTAADTPEVRWWWRDGSTGDARGHLDRDASRALLGRTGELERIEVATARERLWAE